MKYLVALGLILVTVWLAIERTGMIGSEPSAEIHPAAVESDVNTVAEAHDPADDTAVAAHSSDDTGLNVSPRKKMSLNSLCSLNVEDSFFIDFDQERLSQFSQKQTEVFEQYRDKCLAWYDHLAENPEVKETFVQFRQRMQAVQDQILENIDNEVSFEEETRQAKAALKGEGVLTRRTALAMLASYDLDLRRLIANDIGTKKVTYITESANDFFQVYYCRVDPEECVPDGARMVLACLYDAQACGLDYVTYLSLQRSPNHFSDILTMADSFDRIIASGYPD